MTPLAKPIRAAIETLAGRLDRIDTRLAVVDDDGALLAHLSDIESALSSIGASVGIERRSARLRLDRHRAADDAFHISITRAAP